MIFGEDIYMIFENTFTFTSEKSILWTSKAWSFHTRIWELRKIKFLEEEDLIYMKIFILSYKLFTLDGNLGTK